MAERNPDREEPQNGEGPGSAEGPEPVEGAPLDEDAAWAEIVASYGEESVEPPHERPAAGGDDKGVDDKSGDDKGGGVPGRAGLIDGTHSFTVFSAGTGPRDWDAAEASDSDLDATDEGHFVPPEPPPLPKGDLTSRLAWLAVLGGPALLLLMLILQQPMTWWASVLGIGGFLGGFATLVARMRPGGDEDDDPPGGGAVV